MNNLNRIFNISENGLSDTDAIPLYRQIINAVTGAISSKRLRDNDRLPPEPELMKLFKVSRVTLRAAMQELVDDGLLVRIQGKGTFVNSTPYHLSYNRYFGLCDSCKKKGKVCEAVVLEKKNTVPPDYIADFFNLAEKEDILFVMRKFTIDERPAVLEYNYLSRELSSLADNQEFLEEPSIYMAISKWTAVTTIGGRFEFSSGLPDKAEESLLDVSRNTPLLITTDTHYKLPKNTPLFVTIQKTNPELVDYYWERVVELTPEKPQIL